MEDFNGEYTFVAYEKEITEEGYFLTHLDGTQVFYPNPTKDDIEEPPKDVFDA